MKMFGIICVIYGCNWNIQIIFWWEIEIIFGVIKKIKSSFFFNFRKKYVFDEINI